MSVVRRKITVYDYFSGGSILHPLDKGEKSKHYFIIAWCVGGKDGIFAVFKDPRYPSQDITAYAQGDDGHWWFAGRHDRSWTAEIAEAFNRRTKHTARKRALGNTSRKRRS